MEVALDGFTSQYPTPIPANHWLARGGALPQQGDVCVIVVDAKGDSWVVGYERPVSSLVTALPAHPFDGQRIDFLADDPNNVIWPLCYRASTSKWAAVGPTEIQGGGSGANQNLTLTPTATNCSVTIPLAGVYDIRAICQFAGGSADYLLGVIGTAIAGSPLIGYFSGTGGGGNLYESGSQRETLTSGTLSLAVWSGAAAGFVSSARLLWVKPVSLG